MPVSLDTGYLFGEHSHSWSFLVDQDSDECTEAVTLLLAPTTDSPAGYNYGQHVEALAEVLGQSGQKVLQIAKNGPRQVIYKHLVLGYKVSSEFIRAYTRQPLHYAVENNASEAVVMGLLGTRPDEAKRVDEVRDCWSPIPLIYTRRRTHPVAHRLLHTLSLSASHARSIMRTLTTCVVRLPLHARSVATCRCTTPRRTGRRRRS